MLFGLPICQSDCQIEGCIICKNRQPHSTTLNVRAYYKIIIIAMVTIAFLNWRSVYWYGAYNRVNEISIRSFFAISSIIIIMFSIFSAASQHIKCWQCIADNCDHITSKLLWRRVRLKNYSCSDRFQNFLNNSNAAISCNRVR